MGCKKGGFLAPEENGVDATLSDALLFTTMCIIGLPVDVYVKDGSVYSGIFHTACVDDDYGEFFQDPLLISYSIIFVFVILGSLFEAFLFGLDQFLHPIWT